MGAVHVIRFQQNLLSWYDRHRRTLPWRETRSPYRVWISEIMLQQTRVAAVVQRYCEFLKRFPTVRSLASAKSNDVLAAWSGLGYYRRARSAHKAAKLIVSDHGGRFPRDREQLRGLPGVGEYTSAAVASIAFGLPHAVVDGNVRRVLDRLYGKTLSPKSHAASAQELLPLSRPGDFNQAMMELGALVCTPLPSCKSCPVLGECATRGRLNRPVAKPKMKTQRVRFALVVDENRLLLVQRSRAAALMPAMWELPPDNAGVRQNSIAFRHSITNTNYLVCVTPRKQPPSRPQGRWIPLARLGKIPLTGLARKILRHQGLL
jgi:A/G-specific adenine glycosylase